MIDIYVFNTQTQTYWENPHISHVQEYLQNEALYLWVDLFNPTQEETAILSTVFQFDEFAIEDCTHPRQSSKLESFGDYHFFIIQGISLAHQNCDMHELDGFLGDRYLVTYHNEPLQAIDMAKKQILKQQNSRLVQGTAFLAYEILDQVIDMYLPALDVFDEEINLMQKQMTTKTFSDCATQDYIALSNKIIELRRTALKNQQVFYQFSHSPLKFIDPDEARLFRDIYDHTVRVVDMSEYYQQALRGALDIQFSINTHRVNKVVTFLTLFATIMLPLNVLTGIYGMNFDWMPFLHNPHGFWIVSTIMAGIVLAMFYSFRKRGLL